MRDQTFKICSKCGAEYAPSALECVDCGGQLVWGGSEGANAEPLKVEEAQFLVRHGAANYLRELARELGRDGIRSAIVFVDAGKST
jgi:hypothetical protein